MATIWFDLQSSNPYISPYFATPEVFDKVDKIVKSFYKETSDLVNRLCYLNGKAMDLSDPVQVERIIEATPPSDVAFTRQMLETQHLALYSSGLKEEHTSREVTKSI
jgi:hypothetical protein